MKTATYYAMVESLKHVHEGYADLETALEHLEGRVHPEIVNRLREVYTDVRAAAGALSIDLQFEAQVPA